MPTPTPPGARTALSLTLRHPMPALVREVLGLDAWLRSMARSPWQESREFAGDREQWGRGRERGWHATVAPGISHNPTMHYTPQLWSASLISGTSDGLSAGSL